MNLLTAYINLVVTLLPYALPIVGAYLIFDYTKEKKQRNANIKAYAHHHDMSVDEAKKTLYYRQN